MKRQLILEQWNNFARAIYPPGTPAIQLEECRRAFYGGASTLFFTLLFIMDADREPTPDDLEKMAAVQEELTKYAADLKRWGEAQKREAERREAEKREGEKRR